MPLPLLAVPALLGGSAAIAGATAVANSDKTKGIHLVPINKGLDPVIIFVDGFLTENDDGSDWLGNIPINFKKHSMYYLKWESKEFLDVVKEVFLPSFNNLLKKSLSRMFIPKLFSMPGIKDILNIWEESSGNAKSAGKELSKIINNGNSNYILMGHSLGSMVIHSCIKELILLDKNNTNKIKDVYLFGGAVQSNVSEWNNASNIIQGKIHNFRNHNDKVLQLLYRIAEGTSFKFSDPIGVCNIKVKEVRNINVASIINGHTKYHESLEQLFQLLDSNSDSEALLQEIVSDFKNQWV